MIGIRVGPKSTLDIPICFAPMEMTKYEALCTVIVRKEDGGRWMYGPKDSRGSVSVKFMLVVFFNLVTKNLAFICNIVDNNSKSSHPI